MEKESFEAFKNSFSYGSRSDLNFKFFKALSEEEAGQFFQGLLTLVGSNREPANLSYIEEQTNNQRNLAAGKILYRPEDGWTDIQNVQEASMNQNGSIMGSGR